MRKERSNLPEIQISIEEFENTLPKICDASISYTPKIWTPDNPLCGACVPVALVANRLFGGKLLRADLRSFPKFKYMKWHWFNLLPDGSVKDFTRAQFGNDYPEGMKYIQRTSSSVMRHINIAKRTNTLYQRLLGVFDHSNS
jgi:hypothetical protein